MKKAFRIFTLIAMIAAIGISATACNQDSSNASAPAQESSTVSSADESGNEESSKNESTTEESSKTESTAEESSKSEESQQSSAESSVVSGTDIMPEQKTEISLPEENVLQYIFSLDQVKQRLTAMEQQLSNDTITAKMEVEGDYIIVLTCTAVNQLDDSDGKYYDYFEQITNTAADQFDTFVDGMKQLAKLDFLTFDVRFKNADGSIIYSEMFFGHTEESGIEEPSYEASDLINENGHYDTLADFLAAPDLQEDIAEQTEYYSELGFHVTIYAENETTLVYDFKRAEGTFSLEEVATLNEQLNSSSFSDSFGKIASAVQNAVDTQGIAVAVRYSNSDGSVAAEKKYSPTINT